ncbi:hypothetical protein BVY03_02515 [bacterium K02(2017)]|nr:hypothetical protein BVY03_02515 [bacterium K02(2017)]
MSKNLWSYAVIATTLILVFIVAYFPFQSEDLYMYIAIAREFFQTGTFPQTDPFLFSIPNYQWQILHEWACYLFFYAFYQMGGLMIVTGVKAIMIMLTMSFPLLFFKRTPLLIIIWSISCFIVTISCNFRFVERANLFTDLLATLVLVICLIESYKPSKIKYILPLLFISWVNLHPGYMLGWAICLLYLIIQIKDYKKKSYQHFIWLSLLSVVICLFNADGLYGLLYPIIFALNEGQTFQQYYYEWYPTYHKVFHNQPAIWIILIFAFCSWLLLLIKFNKKNLFAMAVFALISIMAIKGVRFIPLLGYFCISILCYWARHFSIPKHFTKGLPIILLILMIYTIKVLAFGYTSMGVKRTFGYGIDPIALPTENLKVLKDAKFKVNMYNSHRFGSYLAWEWGGSPKVFYHGFVTDVDFYIKDYFGLARSKIEFEALVKKHDLKGFLIERLDSAKPIIEMVFNHPEWQLVSKDPASLLFIKKSSIGK